MAGTFFDTSALVKHYHTEAGSAEVNHLWNDPASKPNSISHLRHGTENDVGG